MIQFREIKRIFKEVTGMECVLLDSGGVVIGSYFCPINKKYRCCLYKGYSFFLRPNEIVENDLRQHFKQFI